MDLPSAELVGRWSQGDQAAADELFRRYIGRLTALARGRMSARLARRLDAEDVALSAYRSFFVRARDGRVVIEQSGDLWRLLAAIALNKLHRTVLHHRADKRSMDREQPWMDALEAILTPRLQSGAPATAEEAVATAEEFERFLAGLSVEEREVIELRLQGFEQTEIARRVGRSERTVRRILVNLQRRLERRLMHEEEGSFAAGDDGDEQKLESGGCELSDGLVMDRSPVQREWLSDREFLLARHLGTGGTGKVYQALRKGTREWVAVKVLKRASQTDPEAVRRFLDEAATVSGLQHEGIVPIRGVGRTKLGGYFLVSDWMEGGDLTTASRERRLEVAQAVKWVAAAARAVNHAHRYGVIHCDLKPSNLLLDRSGILRVADFGLAHIMNRPQRLRAAGTLGFMAPEQLDPTFGSIGPATDVFGLGAVLFALLTGRAPYFGEHRDAAVEALFHSPAPTLATFRSDVPGPLDDLCQRCLARDRAERFPTAAELATALEPFG